MGSYARSVHEKMLANLTSLIWGSDSTPSTTTTCPTSEEESETLTLVNIRASTPSDEEESDWVLVDAAEVGDASYGEAQALQLIATASSSSSASSPSSSAAASKPTSPLSTFGETCVGGMQGWLMTPPPCFTRSQVAPLATSPLENLLIEHPSMSVYLPRPTYTSTAIARIFPRRVISHSSPYSRSPPSVSPSSQPTPDDNEDSPMREDAGAEGGNQVVEPPSSRSSVTQRASTLLQAIDVLRPAQKAQRRREERRLKRKPLERSNKAREVAAAGNKRSKRNDMMVPGKFSRAVNNRKC
ncbi:tumor protein p53-inducible nuclear protein 2 isoform X2 [Procambarus clarkii]|uniref:tumor protein p53-inducible nuclear protein 2 isoform X2 n=1 Tax=Procambarus clarkii TaxID=6728 RepID=UPI001E672827|nr:tumor protein p53-inducible nuclear protein 2-like isoform X2 [Procambarus clarkii]XP_045611746.1 tumor protein p53-inducible nuclear protein 2-like isoform X2 [Procambarus clarkii]